MMFVCTRAGQRLWSRGVRLSRAAPHGGHTCPAGPAPQRCAMLRRRPAASPTVMVDFRGRAPSPLLLIARCASSRHVGLTSAEHV